MEKLSPRDKVFFVLMGAVLGIGALLLSYFGNPANTGICASCFLENIAGSIGLHENIRMQYLRPEILGFILGAFFLSLLRREFVPSGGSSPLVRFLIGVFLIVGCSVFIGCPVKLILRLAAGDISVFAGLAGLVTGVYIGVEFIMNGFQLGRSGPTPKASGFVIPGIMLLFLAMAFAGPSFIQVSEKGSAAQHAPMLLSLGIGLLVGGFAQYTQFCITGAIARFFLWGGREIVNCPRSTGLVISMVSFFLFALGAAVATDQFQFGLYGQPSSNDSYGWAFLGMLMVGFGSVLIRGCPLRQMIAAGQGDADAGVTVLGMIVGAALVQNWGLGASAAGTPPAARVAVITGILTLFLIGMVNRKRGFSIAPEYQLGLD